MIKSFFLAGWQPKVYLMPSPIGLEPDTNIFNLADNNSDGSRLFALFATNWVPHNLSRKLDGYSIFSSDDLQACPKRLEEIMIVSFISKEKGTEEILPHLGSRKMRTD